MKKTRFALYSFLVFILFAVLLFLAQYFLQVQGIISLNYRIHFLIFFTAFIGVMTFLTLYILDKSAIIGFAFLGFVVFKLFAMGYIAVFQKDFKEEVLSYFMLYWAYLAAEVLLQIKLLKK